MGHDAKTRAKDKDKKIDKAGEMTFPASDPPSWSTPAPPPPEDRPPSPDPKTT